MPLVPPIDHPTQVITDQKVRFQTNGAFTVQNKNVYEIYHGENGFNTFDEVDGERKRIGKLENDFARVENYDENDPRHIVTYFYHDQLDNEHEVCSTERHRINAKIRTRTVLPENQRGELLETIDFTANRNAGADISASSLEIYEQGTYSDNNGNNAKWYANQNHQVYLVNADIENEAGVGPQTFRALEYDDNSGLRIAFSYEDTRRRYANPEVFAGVIGALAELNLNENTADEYIISEGFAYVDGSCYPSSGHVNGLAFDTHYLTVQEHQQIFIDALSNYGFGRHLVGCNMNYDGGTSDCGQYGRIHENHLHSDRFQTNGIQNINE